METLISLTLPVFIVIALGWAAAKREIVPLSGMNALNGFVFNFAMPALVIRLMATQPVENLIAPRFFTAWLIAGIALFALGALTARLVFKERLGGCALAGQSSAIGNIGFLGLPLVLEAFGPGAAAPLGVALVVDLILLIPASILMLELSAAGRLGGDTLRRAFKGAVMNPFLISIVIGLALSLSGWTVPGPLDRMMGFLGAAAGPTALFAMGLSLASRRVEGDIPPMTLIVFLKLIAHPLIFLGAVMVFDVTPDLAVIGLVLTALPVANNVFVIAQRYQTRVRRISSAILISTLIAIITVTLVIDGADQIVGK